MKKLIMTLVVCFVLVGCSSSSDLITDEKYMKKISKDEKVVDFILDEKHYTLPCAIEEFTKNGWKLTPGSKDEKKLEDIVLRSNEYTELMYKKGEMKIKLGVANILAEGQELVLSEKSEVQELMVEGKEFEDTSLIVKEGIHMNVDYEKAAKVLNDKYGIEGINEDSINYLSIREEDGKISSIRLETVNLNSYIAYISKVEKERIYKEEKESFKNYPEYFPENYENGLNALIAEGTIKVNENFTIVDKVESTSSFTLGDTSYEDVDGGFIYVATDAKNNIYCFNIASNEPPLAIGSTYDICALSSGVIYSEDVPYPLFASFIIRQGEEIIFVSELLN